MGIERQEVALGSFNRGNIGLRRKRQRGVHLRKIAPHKALVSNCRSCPVEPCFLVHVSRCNECRSSYLLGIQSKSSTSRIVLPMRNRPWNCLGFEVVIEARQIFVWVILPERKGRNGTALLRLCPVKDLLVFLWSRKAKHC